MSRPDAYQLANLPIAKKLGYSLALVLGLLLFFSAWFVSVALFNWGSTVQAFVDWGSMLMSVWRASPNAFFTLFGAHAFSLALIYGVTRSLFKRVPLPSGARTAVLAIAALLAILDVGMWLCVTQFKLAETIVGALVLIVILYLLGLIVYLLKAMWWRTGWRSRGEKKHVVVVGGGFAGLYAAVGLDKALGYHEDLEITVIDRRNYFLFPPLLPSVAAGAIEVRQVTYPFRRVFEATNIVFKKESVERIDPQKKLIFSKVDVDADPVTKKLEVVYAETPYDLLVLAPGSHTNTFKTPGCEEHAFFMREVADAIAVRNHIIDCFEHAAREPNAQRCDEMLRFVVVGAGPTGVELASEIQELIDLVLLRRYPEVDPVQVEVVVVQSGQQVLPGWNEKLVKWADTQLGKIKVKLILENRVIRIGPDEVELKDGTVMPTRTCVWCAGVAPAAVIAKSGLSTHKSGRAEVEADCRAKGRDDVFVLGDAAYQMDPKTGGPHPPLGQVAFQQGSATAANLVRLIKGQPTRPFKYFNFGALVSVGAHFAAIDLVGVRLSGFVAWLIWRALYLVKLVGFGNKVRVLIDWTLDLLVERSISQIHSTRQAYEAEALRAARPEDAP